MVHVGGYQGYVEGCSVQRGVQYKFKAFINYHSHMNHDIPQCTHDISPMY